MLAYKRFEYVKDLITNNVRVTRNCDMYLARQLADERLRLDGGLVLERLELRPLELCADKRIN